MRICAVCSARIPEFRLLARVFGPGTLADDRCGGSGGFRDNVAQSGACRGVVVKEHVIISYKC